MNVTDLPNPCKHKHTQACTRTHTHARTDTNPVKSNLTFGFNTGFSNQLQLVDKHMIHFQTQIQAICTTIIMIITVTSQNHVEF